MPRRTLPAITVASPCHASWEDMDGDDRSRFCSQCDKHVYNLSAMTQDEALDLVRETEGRLCVRFYRRKDGTVLTQDCPVGIWAWRKKIILSLTAGFFLFVTLIGVGLSALLGSSDKGMNGPGNDGNFIQRVRHFFNPEPEHCIMGEMPPIRLPPQAPPLPPKLNPAVIPE